jgi:hypothetical protein
MSTDAKKHTDAVVGSINILSQLLKGLLQFSMSSTEWGMAGKNILEKRVRNVIDGKGLDSNF